MYGHPKPRDGIASDTHDSRLDGQGARGILHMESKLPHIFRLAIGKDLRIMISKISPGDTRISHDSPQARF